MKNAEKSKPPLLKALSSGVFYEQSNINTKWESDGILPTKWKMDDVEIETFLLATTLGTFKQDDAFMTSRQSMASLLFNVGSQWQAFCSTGIKLEYILSRPPPFMTASTCSRSLFSKESTVYLSRKNEFWYKPTDLHFPVFKAEIFLEKSCWL